MRALNIGTMLYPSQSKQETSWVQTQKTIRRHHSAICSYILHMIMLPSGLHCACMHCDRQQNIDERWQLAITLSCYGGARALCCHAAVLYCTVVVLQYWQHLQALTFTESNASSTAKCCFVAPTFTVNSSLRTFKAATVAFSSQTEADAWSLSSFLLQLGGKLLGFMRLSKRPVLCLLSTQVAKLFLFHTAARPIPACPRTWIVLF